MQHKEIIAICSEICTKHINTLGLSSALCIPTELNSSILVVTHSYN